MDMDFFYNKDMYYLILFPTVGDLGFCEISGWITDVAIRQDGVYVSIISYDDRTMIHENYRSDTLTNIYRCDGQRGLDEFIIAMYFSRLPMAGTEKSIIRYRTVIGSSLRAHEENQFRGHDFYVDNPERIGSERRYRIVKSATDIVDQMRLMVNNICNMLYILDMATSEVGDTESEILEYVPEQMRELVKSAWYDDYLGYVLVLRDGYGFSNNADDCYLANVTVVDKLSDIAREFDNILTPYEIESKPPWVW